jgi:transcription elongation factor
MYKEMKANEQTIQQIDRFIGKLTQKFPADNEQVPMTDIHVRVSQESGDLMAFDDDDQEITRCVVEEWIDNKDDNFYQSVALVMRQELCHQKNLVENLGIIKPYNFVLEDDDRESIAELYVVDDDTVIIGGDLMEGLEDDLNDFFKRLFE